MPQSPRLLRRGCSGTDVADWQRRLTKLGHPVDADGYYGIRTENATKDFQRLNGLVADGIVGPKTLASAASADEILPTLPAAWRRWHGARPEWRGAPEDTILAVRGIERVSPMVRAKLLDLCAELSIPIDSMAAVISSESSFNPRALNPLPAAGLIQLTTGANLPGYTTADAIRAVTLMSAEEQVDRIVRPYYERMRGARGASPGHLYMLNFLPADAHRGEDFRLGVRDDRDESGKLLWRGKIYAANPGFDRTRRGYFTIGDVYAVAAGVCRAAQGRRVRVDGGVV